MDQQLIAQVLQHMRQSEDVCGCVGAPKLAVHTSTSQRTVAACSVRSLPRHKCISSFTLNNILLSSTHIRSATHVTYAHTFVVISRLAPHHSVRCDAGLCVLKCVPGLINHSTCLCWFYHDWHHCVSAQRFLSIILGQHLYKPDSGTTFVIKNDYIWKIGQIIPEIHFFFFLIEELKHEVLRHSPPVKVGFTDFQISAIQF